MWPFFKRRKPTEILTKPSMDYLGEQDGAVERELKECLRRLFTMKPAVMRAYLCQVRYPDEMEISVALFIVGPEDSALVREVMKIFGEQFDRTQHLDVGFPDQDEEARLALSCRPFYGSGSPIPGEGGMHGSTLS